MPYKGSKSKIAQQIINVLPEAYYFVDLFGGGGAMTHCAALSFKYRKVIYNQIEPLIHKAFDMAVHGKFKNEKRWISREDFFKLKDTDPYAAICFSCGNDCKT
jgi:site-specific DNA-adenine methylase